MNLASPVSRAALMFCIAPPPAVFPGVTVSAREDEDFVHSVYWCARHLDSRGA